MRRCPVCDTPANESARSVPQLRRYFKLIRAYFNHWPEAHDRQFFDAEKLRKWAQMKCGHYEIGTRIPLVQAGSDGSIRNRERLKLIVSAAIHGAGSDSEADIRGDELVIFRPKSIPFHKLPHSEACRIMDEVESFLEAETGLKSDQVLRESEHAA